LALLLGILAATLAGIAQSCLGFGLPLVLAPLALLVMPPTVAVPSVLLLSLLNTSLAALHARRDVRFRLVLPLVVAGMVGFSTGVTTLLYADATLLRLAVGVFVALFSVALMSAWSHPLPENIRVVVAVGLLSGFAGGATSIGGPPLALFLSNQRTPLRIFRANLLAFLFVMNAWGLLNNCYAGLITREVLTQAAIYLPGTLLGTIIGVLLAGRLPEALFRRVVLFFVLTTGTVLTIAALHALLTK
jgi:uncharacterized membrane protein YfcA